MNFFVNYLIWFIMFGLNTTWAIAVYQDFLKDLDDNYENKKRLVARLIVCLLINSIISATFFGVYMNIGT